MQYAIFDMDGTLIDSMPLWKEVAGSYCRERGLSTTLDLNHLFHKMTISQAAEFFKNEFQLKESAQEIMQSLQTYAWEAYANQVPAKEGVEQALANFQNAGYQLGVATANERVLVDLVLDRLGLSQYFSAITTCSEVGRSKKESPAVFETCLKRLGGHRTEEAYVFEDAPHAIISARTAGFCTVGVYDAAYHAENAVLLANCDYYFEQAHLWPTLLDGDGK